MIKAILLSLFVALLMVGCGDGIVDYDDLENRNGVTYLADEETPFTGRAESFYRNGQKRKEVNFKDGKPDGLWTWWNEDGKKEEERTYKDGMEDGLWTKWHWNGQKYKEVTYKDGKKDGLETHWYENGQKKGEGRMKDGKLMEAVQWKPNGEKCPVTNLKDGIGVVVWYREDGTVSRRDSWKNGKLDGISIYYKKDGTEWYRTTYKDGVKVD